MLDGKYAVIITLQSTWNDKPITSTFRFVITVNNNMGRNEVNMLIYEKAKEMTVQGLIENYSFTSLPQPTVQELKSDILFMGIDPE
jgi:hypothetical protein